MIKGKKILLRAPEPEDLDFMMGCENNRENWLLSETIKPFSRNTLRNFLLSTQNIEEFKQIRWVAVKENIPCGILDFFDWDKHHQRVGVGIWVSSDFRQQGFATEMLDLGTQYAFEILMVNQVYAQILSDNPNSESLFKKTGFKKTGQHTAWVRKQNTWLDLFTYQKFQNG